MGPHIITYLAEYILHNCDSHEEIHNLINTRLIILMPLANPSGYFYNIRMEYPTGVDINRDFPYYRKDKTDTLCF